MLLLIIFLVIFINSESISYENNLLKNGDFTNGTNYWTGSCPSPRIICTLSSEHMKGNQSLRVEYNGSIGNTNFYQISQTVAVKPSKTYVFRYCIKGDDRTDTTTAGYYLLNETKGKINCNTGKYCHYFSGHSISTGDVDFSKTMHIFQTTYDTSFVKVLPRQYGEETFGVNYFDCFGLFEAEETRTVEIQSKEIKVTLEESTGSIIGVTDLENMHDFLKDDLMLPLGYSITIKNQFHGSKMYKTNIDASDNFNYTVFSKDTQNGETIELTYFHDDLKITVKCTIEINNRTVNFGINIKNEGKVIIQSVTFPYINVKPKLGQVDETEYFLSSYHSGNLYKNISDLENSGSHYFVMHPGSASTQFQTLYNKNYAIYSQTMDTIGYFKKFGFERIVDDDIIQIRYIHYTGESFGNDLIVNYSFVFKFLHNEDGEFKWQDFADIYKKWSEEAFDFIPVMERKDIPEFVKTINSWHEPWGARQEDYVYLMTEMKKLYEREPYALNESISVLMPGGSWARTEENGRGISWGGIDVWYPFEGDIPLDPLPEDQVHGIIKELLENKVYTYIWFSGNKWDLWEKDENGTLLYNDTDDYIKYGKKYAIIKESGEEYTATNRFCYSENSRFSVMIDIGDSDDNINDLIFVDNIQRGLRRNVSLMSIDQIVGGWPSSFVSWNTNNTDRIGYSENYHKRFIQLLERIREMVERENAELALSIEETSELLIPYLQIHMIRQGRDGSFIVRGMNSNFTYSTNIPIFSYLYSKYALVFDESGSISSRWASKNIVYWNIARSALQGNIPGATSATSRTSILVWNSTFHFYKKIIYMIDTSYRGAETLNPKKILGIPPDFIYMSKGKRDYYIRFFYEPIQYNYFRKLNGDLSFVIVNLNQEGNVSLKVELSKYESPNVVSFDIFQNFNGNQEMIYEDVNLTESIWVEFESEFLDVMIYDIKVKECIEGYDGVSCLFAICDGKYGSDACSGNGDCIEPEKCVCKSGWLGDDCSVKEIMIIVISILFGLFSLIIFLAAIFFLFSYTCVLTYGKDDYEIEKKK